jgi:hypothetical protein
MRDPTIDLVVKELTEIAYQYLCERESLELHEAINAIFNGPPPTDEELSIARKIMEGGLRPPARKRGRPQQRERHLQIAGAVAMLVEDEGLKPYRSHLGRQLEGPSACSIVTTALKQQGEHLDERTVEGIWDRYHRSPLIIHRGAGDYARNHRARKRAREAREASTHPDDISSLKIRSNC